MLFSLTDVILIIIVLIFVIGGFVMGLIQAIGALIGVVADAWIGGIYFMPFGEWLTPYVLGHSGVAKVIAFVIIFGLINRLIGLLFWLIEKAFHLISIIPFLKSINRLGGVLLGFVEGVLITGLVIYMIVTFAGEIEWMVTALNE